MRLSRSCVVHTTAIGLLSLAIFSAESMAQKAAVPASSPAQMPGLQCNGSQIFDPFKDSLAGPNLRPGLLPIDATVKDEILKSGLPCQENVRTGAQGDPAGIEATGLENLQRGFDFYSWRTFIALNSPADGKTPIDKAEADTPTRWEDMDNFKQLLDVMLPADQQPPIWPRDRAGMDAERERLMPEACKTLQQNDPTLRDRKIVKMIEESYNEPFKTGPLIDQDGHYAIFDILMNREMFDYITEHHLNTKAGQAADGAGGDDAPIVGLCPFHSGIAVDVEPGPGVQNNPAQCMERFDGRQGTIGRDDDIGQLCAAITADAAAVQGRGLDVEVLGDGQQHRTADALAALGPLALLAGDESVGSDGGT